MQKIVLAGFPNVKNFGDPILFESAEYLIKSIIDEETTVVRLDLFGEKNNKIKTLTIKVLNRLMNTLIKKEYRNTSGFYGLQKKLIKSAVYNYYRHTTENADAIIFAGGGMLKYKYETCDFRLTILTEMAEELNIPVAFNAVGVEGYSAENIRCQKMKESLNNDIVKSITTRDDIDLLNDKYIYNNNVFTAKVADSAFWSDKVYNISNNKNSKIVGLGVVRGGIFQDNGISMTEDELLNLWVGIIEELDSKAIEWKLFTNGLGADNEFLYKLLKKIGRLDEEELVRIPRSPKELVEIISEFQTVIACRMHASIVSYSLDVPSVGLVWNDKIRMFGETIGHPDRFISHQEFSPKRIVEKMINIELNEEDINFKNDFRQTTLKSVERFINIIRQAKK